MTPFSKSLLRTFVRVEGVTKRVWEGFGRVFLSKEQAARRDTDRFETFKRREMEEERLDRLRNPGNYRGR